MEYDVVIVGGGPSGLATAIKLKQLNADVNVCVLEKGAEIGSHILSGNVFETRALDELVPNWKDLNAFRSFQLGTSSSKALVSKTFPDKICEPISAPFSSTHTLTSAFSCFNLMAVARPDGPPPTMTTSYSITSLVMNYF